MMFFQILEVQHESAGWLTDAIRSVFWFLAKGVLILLYGMWIFYDWRLWKNMRTDFGNILQIFLPISVLGFSGILYGIATLLNKDK